MFILVKADIFNLSSRNINHFVGGVILKKYIKMIIQAICQIDFGIKSEHLPPHLLAEETSFLDAYARFCRELMNHLKGAVPAVRFPFGAFALLGGDGLQALKALLEEASQLGFYVILDAPEILSPWAADRAAELIFGKEAFPCD